MFCWRTDDGPALNAGWAAFCEVPGGGGEMPSISVFLDKLHLHDCLDARERMYVCLICLI